MNDFQLSYDDNFTTETIVDQNNVEKDCIICLNPIYSSKKHEKGFEFSSDGLLLLSREKTIDYLEYRLFNTLKSSYTVLDCSRPWMLYWILHSLTLLNKFPTEAIPFIRNALKSCLSIDGGGFGGGFSQIGHSVSTYASVLTICMLGDEKSFRLINRNALYIFFLSLKDKSGGFRVHKNGEMDTRGIYSVLSVASIVNILTPELILGCAEFIAKCQTYEGGLASKPENEANGGYAFCGFASLCILNRIDIIDLDAFIEWLSLKQMRLEGGFQGRTNKLVDSCYSFWQGSIFAMLKKYAHICSPSILYDHNPDLTFQGDLLFDQLSLQRYILECCQNMHGGLIDKPGKPRDLYHTCYALSGLSIAQENGKVTYGDSINIIKEIDPVFNLEVACLKRAMEFFQNEPNITHS